MNISDTQRLVKMKDGLVGFGLPVESFDVLIEQTRKKNTARGSRLGTGKLKPQRELEIAR